MDYSKNLLIKVCEFYYNMNMNQQQIANKLNISRVKVSRLLSEAKNKGIVKIEIRYPGDNCIQTEGLLENRYGLEEAVIISSKDKSEDLVFSEVTKIAAEFMEEKITPKDIIGLAWGRTIKNMTYRIPQINKGKHAVQLLGNIGSIDVSGDVIVRKIANALGTSMSLLPAPAIVDSKHIKEAIMSDGKIKSIFEDQKKCTIAFVGIGEANEKSILVETGYLKEEDLTDLKNAKAKGEICGRFIDEKGELCKCSIDERVLGISFEDLKNIPLVVAIATGKEKAEAMKAVLKSGAVNVLITDEVTASLL
ncbi:sugar-binding transcriptional regulator [Alkalibacter saccharofermentans]|uniref:DNA-binding transcriptional regulator LsrR, DeoR family n=1 Tax=Alkalibacter saccharofermentans DSM 14828 TaxID=1120975 RepID=A0A1M4VZG2_9FIRM|nr:sugar-binding transcriptional regulator [Alkalibacter saccharofermentans]SHE74401.1 DNA-binding transcriptional regulator LsrR, DeoR family [Alkalibacter saccharofermentans DSM 14828]